MTKPKSEEERIDEFAEALYIALSHTKDDDYPTDEALMKGSLGVLHHSRHTVGEMEKIINRIVRRVLHANKLRIVRKEVKK